MHQICRYVLYVATNFRLNFHHSSYFNGAQRRTSILRNRYGTKKPEVGLRYSDVMPALSFSAISESNSCRQRCLIPKITLASLVPDGDLKRLGARHGWCPHTVAVWLQEYPIGSYFNGLQIAPTDILPPSLKALSSVRWAPMRFERIVVVLITNCVHRPGDCTRAPSR